MKVLNYALIALLLLAPISFSLPLQCMEDDKLDDLFDLSFLDNNNSFLDLIKQDDSLLAFLAWKTEHTQIKEDAAHEQTKKRKFDEINEQKSFFCDDCKTEFDDQERYDTHNIFSSFGPNQ